MTVSLWTVVRRSLCHYRAANLAVGLGVAVAVAVLVGSLAVGDSVQQSLRQLALERLGSTHDALTSRRFFDEQLSDKLRKTLPTRETVVCAPIITTSGAVRLPDDESLNRPVNVLGVDGFFWNLWNSPAPSVEADRVAISSSLARELKLAPGDVFILSLRNPSRTPMDTVFGLKHRRDLVVATRLTVGAVLPARDAGLFSLRGDQPRPYNVYLPLPELQRLLKEPGKINTVLRGSTTPFALDVPGVRDALTEDLTLDDYSLTLTRDASGSPVLKSRTLLLSPAMVEAARRSAEKTGFSAVPTSVYLANSLEKANTPDVMVPYSIIAGMPEVAGRALAPDEIALNQWTADDLQAKSGDTLSMSFFVSDPHGALQTIRRTFKLVAVLPMNSPEVDDTLVPVFQGMTDAKTMREWNPPFPVDLSLIRAQDDDYWERYHTTPKAFVHPEVCRALWLSGRPQDSSGSSWITGVRLTTTGGANATPDRFSTELLAGLSFEQAGLDLQPVRTQALRSAQATQDFSTLFLSMSLFLVIAALALIVLLMRLTIERRASQVGIMLAVGFRSRTVRYTLIFEALVVIVLATLLGIPLGLAYAALIMKALGSFWSGAVGEFPLRLFVTPRALMLGGLSGFVVALLGVLLSLRALARLRAVALLRPRASLSAGPAPSVANLNRLGVLFLAVAGVLWLLSTTFKLVPTQIAFFLGGASAMIGALFLLAARLRHRPARQAQPVPTLWGLALRGASRNRTRSMLAVTLLACASFIIVTVATFGRDPAKAHPGPPESGTGSFNLVVTTRLPLFQNLGSAEGCKQLGLTPETTAMLVAAEVFPLRMSTGEDISCLNIQQVAVPRLLGITDRFIERGGFSFSARNKPTPQDASDNAWHLLKSPLPDDSIPAFADAETAQWNLHKPLGATLQVPTSSGASMDCRLVGLLNSSIFAGELLVSEDAFLAHFGAESGYGMFLIRTGPDLQMERQLAEALVRELADFGVTVTRTSDLLAVYAQVQNTYLSTFQTLGGLGLILGTFGLVTVLLRNILERRSELAMMLAVGFRRRQLVRMVLLENVFLLVIGIVIGAAGALAGSLPQLVATQTSVNWTTLALTLLLTFATGSVSCVVAAHVSMRTDLLAGLRAE